MAAFNKFNSFVEALAEKVHNLGSDTLKVMLTNTAPVATNTIKADLTEIAAGNGYTAGGNTASVTSSTQTGGLYRLVLGDPATWTASGGGSIGPFQYAVLFNDSATNDELIGWWDYGSAVTLADGESFAVDFDPTTGVLTLA
jgi:hypothetical protein